MSRSPLVPWRAEKQAGSILVRPTHAESHTPRTPGWFPKGPASFKLQTTCDFPELYGGLDLGSAAQATALRPDGRLFTAGQNRATPFRAAFSCAVASAKALLSSGAFRRVSCKSY